MKRRGPDWAPKYTGKRRVREPRRPTEDALFEREPDGPTWDDAPEWARRWFARLTPRDRELLAFRPELPAPEVAALLGIKTATLRQVRARLRRKALRAFPPELHERVLEILSERSAPWHFPLSRLRVLENEDQ